MTPWGTWRPKALLLGLIVLNLWYLYGRFFPDLPEAVGYTEEEIFNV